MDLRGDLRLPFMLGSSLAAPSAAPWVTDFLAAAYYAHPDARKDVADLRLAHGIVATRWEQSGRRVGARDWAAFARAFHSLRLAGRGGRFGTLDRDALLRGANALIGPWFADAWHDDARRAHGIAFATVQAREAHIPERRLEVARLGPLTPPRLPAERQRWHTYPAVGFDAAALPQLVDLLTTPERWPDFASALGGFAPLHAGGLRGQSFEIDVAIDPLARAPLWTRGYVTAVRVLADDDAARYVAGLQVDPVGPSATVRAAVELVTHRGHFLGRAISRLIVFEDRGRGAVCDVGSWDPLSVVAAAGYRLAGRRAQHRFWSDEVPDASMLHQLARRAEDLAGCTP